MFRQLPSLRRRVLLPPDAAVAVAADDDAFAFAKPFKRKISQRIAIESIISNLRSLTASFCSVQPTSDSTTW